MSISLPKQGAPARERQSPACAVARRLLPRPARRRAAMAAERLAHLGLYLTPRGRASLARLAALRDSRRGETCVILGNGPSLGELDVARLDGLATFCLNRGYLLWQGTGRAPSYFVAVNDLVIAQFHREIAALPCPLFLPWRHRRRFAGVANAVFFEVRWDERFIGDARRGVCPSGTVTNAALQIAYHLGFAKVVLLGIDHRFDAQGAPHTPVRQHGGDPDHFRADYFADGTVWNLPDLARSERGYALARAAFEADGRRIVNATPGTALEAFERAELEQALPGLPRPGGRAEESRPPLPAGR